MSGYGYIEAWWDADTEDERGRQAFQAARYLQDVQSHRNKQAERNHQLWRQAAWGTFRPGGVGSNFVPLSLNIVKAGISTIHSRVCKAQERLMFTTDQGDYEQRESAKIHTRFADGVSYSARLKAVEDEVTQDSLLYGSGIIKRMTRGTGKSRRFAARRVFPTAFVVNDLSGDTDPTEKYEFILMSRRELLARYPEKSTLIDETGEPSYGDTEWHIQGLNHYSDSEVFKRQVLVVQAWLEESSPGAGDGRFAVCLENGLLEEGPWNEPAPYAKLDWQPGSAEYWGHGVPEELMGIQLEINVLIRKIKNSIAAVAGPFILADKGSQVNPNQLRADSNGRLVTYVGREPRVVTPTAMNQEVYAHLDRLYSRGFELLGTPMMSVSGQGSPGIESGRAMLVQQDVSTLRYASFESRRSEWHRETIFGFIREAKRNPKMALRAVGKDYVDVIKGADLTDDEDAFQVKAWPVSILPQQPAGKLQALENLTNVYANNGQQLPAEYLAAQMGDPDLELLTSRLTASVRLAEKMTYNIIQKGIPAQWDPNLDQTFFINHFRMEYTRALADGVPADRLNLLRIAIEQGVSFQNDLREQEMAAQQEQMAAQQPELPPEGMPAPPAE